MATKRHLYEVDLMRAFVIMGVVSVHSLSFFNTFAKPLSGLNLTFDALMSVLHFTREVFMFITALVLFITHYKKPITPLNFWARRFKLIVIPYIAWTLLYILFEGTYLKNFVWSWSYVLHTFGHSLMVGNQFFLYYLVLTMQFYLIFPAMVWLLRKLTRWHLHIFIISFVIEIGLMAYNQFVLQGMTATHLPAILAFIFKYRDRFVLTYQFWFIMGALVAIHYAKVEEWMAKHFRAILISLVAAVPLLVLHMFYDRIGIHESEDMAVLVLQPIMIPYSTVILWALWSGGRGWAKRRQLSGWRPFSFFIEKAAAGSFGIFLFHPIVLHYVSVFVYKTHLKPGTLLALAPLAVLFIYSAALVAVHFIGKIPYVSYIVGLKASFPTLRKKQEVAA